MKTNEERDRINALLDDLAERNGVRILMAVESGSRAWGFESPDSDYDVRFIYVEPVEKMLMLFPDRDVIEEETAFNPDGSGVPVDLVGWSLTKALRLGVSSNPQLAEWVSNDQFYQVDPDFLPKLATLTQQSDPRVLGHHYRGLAKRAQHEYLMIDADPVAKKYLYATRAVLASNFMVQNPHIGMTPPVVFSELRAAVAVPAQITKEIDDLLEFKMAQSEKNARRRLPILDEWIGNEIEKLSENILEIPSHDVDKGIAEKILSDTIFDKRSEDLSLEP